MKKRRMQYAFGNTVGAIGQELAPLLEGLLPLLNGASETTTQPLVNAQTMKNMTAATARPTQNFAMGGGVDECYDNAGNIVPCETIGAISSSPTMKKALKKDKSSVTNGYGKYSGIVRDGVTIENPSEIEYIQNMVDYLKNNMPESADVPSNVYRGEFMHQDSNIMNPRFKRKMKAVIGTEQDVPMAAYGASGDPTKPYDPVSNPTGYRLNTAESTAIAKLNLLAPKKIKLATTTIPNLRTDKYRDRLLSAPKPKLLAFGGTADEISDEDVAALQEEADIQGISIEELVANMMGGEEEEEGMEEADDEEYYNEEDDVFTEEDEEEYAFGGNVPIEAEGQEVMQTPDGDVGRIQGPSHENGGVDLNVPAGTDIYSKRLAIDGKTMAERKLARERSMAKVAKKIGDTPGSAAKNTLARMLEINQAEEEQDMAIQKAAGQVYGQPQQIAAYGLDGDPDPELDLESWLNGNIPPQRIVNAPVPGGYIPQTFNKIPVTRPVTTPPVMNMAKLATTNPLIVASDTDPVRGSADGEDTAGNLTLGDTVGMAGNIFNAVAPLVNTVNAAKSTLPNINRFRGYGRKAIEANDVAQGYVDKSRLTQLSDLGTSTGSARLRNRNSARGVNTLRALDAATTMGANKAVNTIANTHDTKMSQLLGQRGQLETMKDKAEMEGQTAVDIRSQQDLDNYYSNIADNLVNAGTNIQGLGKNLNVTEKNKDLMDMLGMTTANNIRLVKKGGKWTIAKNK